MDGEPLSFMFTRALSLAQAKAALEIPLALLRWRFHGGDKRPKDLNEADPYAVRQLAALRAIVQ